MRYHVSYLILSIAGFVVFINEYLIFYLAVLKCDWSCPEKGCSSDDLKAIMIADTHLLGNVKGHWLDKMKREWQMRRSFASAVGVHDPDVVFFLGDLLDEGQWAHNDLFHEYSKRFRQIFGEVTRKNEDLKKRPLIYALAGNHDLGFHYAINPGTVDLFRREFRRNSVDEVVIKGHRFVLITSMALHGDGCRFCHEAEKRLEEIGAHTNTSPPILLQHFPLFRSSDAECDGIDARHVELDISETYREKWETLSREATQRLVNTLKPRVVFDGHTHRMCRKRWENFDEYTINSFSWRNGDVPAFLMVVVGRDQITVEVCRLPSESRQIMVYVFGAIILVFVLVFRALRSFGFFCQPRFYLPSYNSIDYKIK